MTGQSRWPFTQGTGRGRYYCTIFMYSLPCDFMAFPFGLLPTGWITNALLWGAVGAILALLTCDHRLLLFWFAVCSAGCIFTCLVISSFRNPGLIHSGLSSRISETPHHGIKSTNLQYMQKTIMAIIIRGVVFLLVVNPITSLDTSLGF